MYEDAKQQPPPPDNYFFERTILSARNDDVDDINSRVLKDFPGEEKVYHSADSIERDHDTEDSEMMYPVEYLNSINASGLPLHRLALKIGCPVMVLRNLDPGQGVCNGTRGVITRMSNRVVEICLIGGDHVGEKVFIPRISLTPSNVDIPFTFKRRQFPLRLAFCMSINKSQGQSVKYVGLDFRTEVFTHGQFYVAVSRATSAHRVKAIWDPRHQNPITQNIVYPEVLLD